MPRINLLGGSFPSRDFNESRQEVVNLYPESVSPEQGEPNSQNSWLATPGLTFIAACDNAQKPRCLYTASNGDLYAVWGVDIYYIDKKFTFKKIGSFKGNTFKPVKMADNGVNLIMCDGSGDKEMLEGYSVELKKQKNFKQITATGWLGSNHLDFTDTFFVANYPDTPTFYISGSEDITFDPLDFASKTTSADNIVGAVVSHRNVWLIGVYNTTIFFNTGGGGLGTTTSGNTVNTFPFEIMPGVAMEDGCAATYSIAKTDTLIFWLGQNIRGGRYVLMGSGNKAERISTHALEYQFDSYKKVDDAIGYCRVQNGHYFYVLTFPYQNITWVYDVYAKSWHKWSSSDADGNDNRHLGVYYANAYGKEIVADWRNGNLYALDQNNYTDNTYPIRRYRTFPQIQDPESNNRIYFKTFTAQFSVGQITDPNSQPWVRLLISDDSGRTWAGLPLQSLGNSGEYRASVNWNRLGMSRSRVFALEWSSSIQTTLQGCWVDIQPEYTERTYKASDIIGAIGGGR